MSDNTADVVRRVLYLCGNTKAHDALHDMEEALKAIGYSKHTNSPRKGPKAQMARWGLGQDDKPND